MKSISIHLTDVCNNSCKFCVVGSNQKAKENVNMKILKAFIKESQMEGYKKVNIHGGEPTESSVLMEVLDYICECDFEEVTMQTNARKLNDIEFAKKLVDRRVNLFVVSLHGLDAEMHDWATAVQGSFEEALQGIKNVLKLGAKIRTNTVICKKNYMNLSDIIRFIASLGVYHINISNMHPTGKAFVNFSEVVVRLTDIMPYLEEAIHVLDNTDIVLTIEGFPLCVLNEYEKEHLIDWDENQFKLLFHKTLIPNYDEFMQQSTKKHGEVCKDCNSNHLCGGVYKEYLHFYGWNELETCKLNQLG